MNTEDSVRRVRVEEEKEDVLSERENCRYCEMKLEEEEEDMLSKGED